jgi:hypothetical protein
MKDTDAGSPSTASDDCILIGYNAGGGTWANQDCSNLIGIGTSALAGALEGDTADGTVAIGKEALTALTSGADNLAIGHSALDAMTNGDGNLAIGKDALGNLNHTDANNNIAIGAYAGDAMGAYANMGNIFIGYAAGSGTFASASSENIAIGYLAMNSPLDDADGNIAIGALSLQDITQGDKNVSIGYYAGREITTGHSNVIIGGSSLVNDTDGANSVVIGYQAGNGLTGSTENTIMGYNACGNFDSTADNLAGVVAIGTHALYGSTETSSDASNTVAIGRNACYGITTGLRNVAVGAYALDADDDCDYCTAIGYEALTAQTGTSGTVGNTAVGYQSGKAITTGTKNTTLGYQSGVTLEAGTENTILGHLADTDTSSRSGCVVIGYGLSLNTASNNVVEIGNDTNSMTYDLDGGDITVTSDVRTKTNIKDSNLGLEFINKLRPVTYETKPSAEYPKEFGVKNPIKKKSGKTWDGLIAQEVKQVMDDMDVGFSGWSEGVNTKQTLAYGKLVMPLIKAVQELSSKVEDLEKQLKDK